MWSLIFLLPIGLVSWHLNPFEISCVHSFICLHWCNIVVYKQVPWHPARGMRKQRRTTTGNDALLLWPERKIINVNTIVVFPVSQSFPSFCVCFCMLIVRGGKRNGDSDAKGNKKVVRGVPQKWHFLRKSDAPKMEWNISTFSYISTCSHPNQKIFLHLTCLAVTHLHDK